MENDARSRKSHSQRWYISLNIFLECLINLRILNIYGKEYLKKQFIKTIVLFIYVEGIIHSDLKPSNFLVVGCQVKLIDFNISNSIASERTSITMKQDCGTLAYMAPETLHNDDEKTGEKKDEKSKKKV